MRIDSSVNDFFSLQKKVMKGLQDLVEVLNENEDCQRNLLLQKVFQKNKRIDFVMGEKEFLPIDGGIVHSKNNWTSTQGTSDHPGVRVKIKLK